MLRTLYRGHMSRVNKLWELFTRRNFEEPVKQSLGSKRYWGDRETKRISKGSDMIIHSTAR